MASLIVSVSQSCAANATGQLSLDGYDLPLQELSTDAIYRWLLTDEKGVDYGAESTGGFPITFITGLANGNYTSRFSIRDGSTSYASPLRVYNFACQPLNPGPAPIPPCRLSVSATPTKAGDIAYVISGAVDGPVDVLILRVEPVASTIVATATQAQNGSYLANSPLFTTGNYQLIVSQQTGTPYACTASAELTLNRVQSLPMDPVGTDPAPVEVLPDIPPLQPAEPPVEIPGVEFNAYDTFLIVTLRQHLVAAHALAELPGELLAQLTVPAGLSSVATGGFAQAGIISGETSSRLPEVAGYDAATPYVVGEHGVTAVTPHYVEYTLNEVQYHTRLDDGFTTYRLTYVDPLSAGLLSPRFLVGDDIIPYHERRPLANNISLQRNEQPVLLDFYAVARATGIDQLPVSG